MYALIAKHLKYYIRITFRPIVFCLQSSKSDKKLLGTDDC